ncbi:alpha/beta fold hydrolase [Paracoccus caeni]|uniref:Alpha/beta fold hydrolase n=1 Tax=Paracoccus caeni TaxID=657651 RepID=A0A934VXF8_9RHOB|nr:alpha/beta fold hydrolase [Paracoccus caeni]MBK4214937.1 alpha/beta fold hydrolase [Paracoccus caeni]
MMLYLFSRRTYDPATKKFGFNPATLTRYLQLKPLSGTKTEGAAIDPKNWVAGIVGQAESKDILIFVHGFNTWQTDVLRRQQAITENLKKNGYKGAVIAFDWPSDGDALRYAKDRNDAKAVAAAFLSDGVQLLQREAPGHRIHILAYSMGAFLVLRSFSVTAGDWKVGEVMFTAADIEAEWMQAGSWGALVMERRCDRLQNYFNTSDDVLSLSQSFINGSERAGRHGLPAERPKNFFNVYCTDRYKANYPQASDKLSHGWYFEDARYYKDLALTLSGMPVKDMGTRAPTDTGGQALKK